MLTFNPWLLLKIWAIVFCLKTGGGQKNSPFTPLPLPLRCKETIFQTYCLDVEVYYHSHYRHHIHPQRHLYHDQLQWDQIWKTNPTSFNSFILHHHRHHRHHQLHQHKDHSHCQEYPTSLVEAALTNQPQLSQQLFKQLFQPQCRVSWDFDFGIFFEWVEIATQIMTQSRHQIKRMIITNNQTILCNHIPSAIATAEDLQLGNSNCAIAEQKLSFQRWPGGSLETDL